MPDMFEFASRYFWLLGIFFAALNTFVAWRRAAPEMAQKAELQEGYNRLFSGYAGIQILPWLVRHAQRSIESGHQSPQRHREL